MADTPANSANEFNTESPRPEGIAEAPTAGTSPLQDMANELWVDDDARAYLLEIDRFPLLDPQEEVDLAVKIKAGAEAADRLSQASQDGVVLDDAEARRLARIQSDGDAAKDQLISSNLRLVAPIAKRYIFRGVPFMDLVYEGNLGLLRAAERFDPASGAAFSVYASWWIRAAIFRALGRRHWGCFPLDSPEAMAKIDGAFDELARELGRNPTPEEIAERTGLPVDQVRELRTISLDPPAFEDSVEDEPKPPLLDDAELAQLKAQVENVLSSMSERERDYIRFRFGLENGSIRTFGESAPEPGVVCTLPGGITRERARQIEAKFLAKLRNLRGTLGT
jgi:RNA polymerase primary sigma factor